MAKILHENSINYIISYAGRVNIIQAKDLNKRIGGFGGILKMSHWLKDNKISHVVDASHPFAKQISQNTYQACINNKTPLVRLTRKPWVENKDDNWKIVNSYEDVGKLLNINKSRIFLAIGRQNLNFFWEFSKHFYLLRMVEEPQFKIKFKNYHCVISRGPFKENEDISLLKKFKINLLISKNSGGNGAFSKIQAARKLKIPIIMINRPILPKVKEFTNFENVIRWLN